MIAGSTKTGPAYITAGNSILLHANLSPDGITLSPSTPVTWKVESQPNGSPTIPAPDPNLQSLDMVVQPSRDYLGKYVISVTVCCHQDTFTIYAYDVSLKTVTYSGNNKVIPDSDAASPGTEYESPHYTAPTDTTSELSKPFHFGETRK